MDWKRSLDPDLYDLYARKLLVQGWPGQLSAPEKAYRRDVADRRRETRESSEATQGSQRGFERGLR